MTNDLQSPSKDKLQHFDERGRKIFERYASKEEILGNYISKLDGFLQIWSNYLETNEEEVRLSKLGELIQSLTFKENIIRGLISKIAYLEDESSSTNSFHDHKHIEVKGRKYKLKHVAEPSAIYLSKLPPFMSKLEYGDILSVGFRHWFAGNGGITDWILHKAKGNDYASFDDGEFDYFAALDSIKKRLRMDTEIGSTIWIGVLQILIGN